MSDEVSTSGRSNMDEFTSVFSNLIGGLALIIAALPTAITWTGLIPQLSPDFRLFSQVAVSVVCYLCIGLVFHYRRYLAKVNFGSSQPSWGKTNLLALLIGCPIASVISFLAYYHAVINNLTLSVWPLFAYICAFSFPVIGLSLMAVREYAQNKLGLSDETLFAKEDHES